MRVLPTVIKINQKFLILNNVVSVEPKGMNWVVHTTSPRNPEMQLPIDTKKGHEIGVLLENLWAYTQRIASEEAKINSTPEKKAK
jgi:hypothetical protein